MSKRHYLLGLGIAGVFAVILLAGLALRGRDTGVRIETAEVTSGTVARSVMATGVLKPERSVDVGSQVSGTIVSIDADFNSIMRAGQVLARLDPSAYEAKLAEAEARVAQAQNEQRRLQVILDDARAKLARSEELAAEEQMSRAELDQARTIAQQAAADVKGAAANVAAAQATVTLARVNLNHTTIRSPIDGVVVNRHVEVGQTIAASVQTPVLFTIADLRRMQLLAEVAEGDVGGVRPGSTVSFQIESLGDRIFDGKVSAVRLQPLVEQSTASASGAATPSAATGTSSASTTSVSTAATTGSRGASQSSGSTTQPVGTTASGTPSTQQTQGASSATAASSTSQRSGSSASKMGVVTYVAVIDVNNVEGAIPPGGTAIITLDGPQRPNVVRLPNTALSFQPSVEAFAAVNQKPPILNRPSQPSGKKAPTGARQAYVWKFENRQFVPILVEIGLANDSWTELVSGSVSPGDALLTSAVPTTQAP